MKTTVDQLWARVLAEIGRRGLLPIRSEPLTPHEIAEQLRARDADRTVHRFVHEYFYPMKFGQTLGSMSEREAEVLVAAFESGSRTPDSVGPVQAEIAICRVCNHRPISSSPE